MATVTVTVTERLRYNGSGGLVQGAIVTVADTVVDFGEGWRRWISPYLWVVGHLLNYVVDGVELQPLFQRNWHAVDPQSVSAVVKPLR